MSDDKKDIVCDGCFHITPAEDHPRTKEHWCNKYKSRVLHIGYHPHLRRLLICEKEDGKKIEKFNRYTALTKRSNE